MIRDNNTIYGEPNDPNTVLSESELPVNTFVVGAGNRGVKQFAPGAKRLLVTDSYGNASSISYDIANKAVGTDENGNIVMRDLPHQYTFFKFGANNKIVKLTSTSDGITYTLPSDNSQGIAKAIVSKNITNETEGIFTVTFDLPLILSKATDCLICASVSFNQPLTNFILLDNNDTPVTLDLVDEDGGVAINKTVTIPAGIYKRLQFKEATPSKEYNSQALIISCLICY